MPPAYVYGRRGKPTPTRFNILPESIADPYSQDRMAAPQRSTSPMLASAAGGAAPAPATSTAMTAPGAAPRPNLSPWGAPSATGGGVSSATDTNPNDPFTIIRNLLGGANSAHGGNALGPDYLMNLLRKNAFQRSKNQRRRGDVMSRLVGLDPMQQQQAMLDTDRSASSDLTGALNEADIQGGMGYRDLLMRLLMSERGDQASGIRDRYQAGEARGARRGGLGGFLGGVAGSVIPNLFGGDDERDSDRELDYGNWE